MDRHIQPLLETQRFQVVRIKHRSSDGVEHTRDMMQHPGAVTVIPMVDEQHVCLIRNFRIGVNQTLVELPAGTLEAGEDPGQCASSWRRPVFALKQSIAYIRSTCRQE